MVSIQCISNLNIDVLEQNCNIKEENSRIVNFLESICNDSDVVILNGDTFNLSDKKGWDNNVDKYMTLLKTRQDIINFIIDKILLGEIKYVVGDKDWVIRERALLPMVERQLSLRYDAVSVLVEHGHYPDMMDFKSGILGWPLSKIILGVESVFWKDADIKIARAIDMYPPPMECQKKAYRKYAHKLVKSKKSDIIVLGHSCFKDNDRIKDRSYVSIGTPKVPESYMNVVKITINKGKYSIRQSLVNL